MHAKLPLILRGGITTPTNDVIIVLVDPARLHRGVGGGSEQRDDGPRTGAVPCAGVCEICFSGNRRAVVSDA
jgi:hypothetical protein